MEELMDVRQCNPPKMAVLVDGVELAVYPGDPCRERVDQIRIRDDGSIWIYCILMGRGRLIARVHVAAAQVTIFDRDIELVDSDTNAAPRGAPRRTVTA